MIGTIFIGSLFIVLTVFVQVLFFEMGQTLMQKYGNKILGSGTMWRKTAILGLSTLWMLAAISISIWIWALGFMVMGSFDDMEESLYFSMVSFTTLGFGDVVLEREWRLLSGIIAANGLLIVGLNTAILIDVLARMRDGDMRTYNDRK